MIIRIKDQKSVVDGFLQALGDVTFRYERTSRTGSSTFFNTDRLSQIFVMSLNIVNDNSPFTGSVNGSQRLDIGSLRWAQICLLDKFLKFTRKNKKIVFKSH